MDETPQYRMRSTSLTTAKIEDIPLSQSSSELTRKVLRAEVIENQTDREKSVKFAIVLQRRTRGRAWSDLGGKSLAQLKAGDAAKIQLDTRETYDLLKHLLNLYEIGRAGVRSGYTVLRFANEDQVIQTDRSRARLIRKLLDGEFGDEIWALLAETNPGLATRLSMSKIYQDRMLVLDEFERSLGLHHNEHYWKRFLKQNRWIFGASYIEILEEDRIDIHHQTDIPFAVEGGFMDIVELKKPDLRFWAVNTRGDDYWYRGKFLVPHAELRGAISQLSGYILQAEKQVGSSDYIKDHQGVVPLKPRGVVVHGRSHTWEEAHWSAFRLLNDELHGIQVITFDHLLQRAKKSLDMFRPEQPRPMQDSDIDDDEPPF
jgi:antiviral defense system Shedu protein SduA